MDYNRLKTRLKDKLTKEYRRTKHTEEYQAIEGRYKKTRECVRMMEVEIQVLLDIYSQTTFYENITNGLYSKLEIVKDTLKRGNRPKSDASKEETDVFGMFSATVQEMSLSTGKNVSEKYKKLAYGLKKVSAARVQMKEGLTNVLYVLRELKEQSKELDNKRLKILEIRQNIETEKNTSEQEHLKGVFQESCMQLQNEMTNYFSSVDLCEIAASITASLKNFFGDSFDAMVEEESNTEN